MELEMKQSYVLEELFTISFPKSKSVLIQNSGDALEKLARNRGVWLLRMLGIVGDRHLSLFGDVKDPDCFSQGGVLLSLTRRLQSLRISKISNL